MVRGKLRSFPTSHIGIAVYTSGHPCDHWVIVLSSNRLFEGTVLCGTVFEDVNGWHLTWTTCDDSPATWSHYMSFQGVVHVAKAQSPMTHIQGFISTAHRRRKLCRMDDDDDEVLPFDTTQTFAVETLLHLFKEDYVSSPAPARVKFFVSERVKRFGEKPKPNHHSYPVVSLEGEIAFCRTRF